MNEHYKNVRDDILFGLKIMYVFQFSSYSDVDRRVAEMMAIIFDRLLGPAKNAQGTDNYTHSCARMSDDPDEDALAPGVIYTFEIGIKLDEHKPKFKLRVGVKDRQSVPYMITCGEESIQIGSPECWLRICDAVYMSIASVA